MQKSEIQFIKAIAFSFHKTTNLDVDDLFQEAAIAYLKGADTFKPGKAAIKTHLYTTMRNHLIDYTRKEMTRKKTVSNDLPVDRPVLYKTFFEFLNNLSESSQEIVRVVLQNKNIILMDNPRQMQGFVRKKMLNYGYNHRQIRKNIKKLKCELKTA